LNEIVRVMMMVQLCCVFL